MELMARYSTEAAPPIVTHRNRQQLRKNDHGDLVEENAEKSAEKA